MTYMDKLVEKTVEVIEKGGPGSGPRPGHGRARPPIDEVYPNGKPMRNLDKDKQRQALAEAKKKPESKEELAKRIDGVKKRELKNPEEWKHTGTTPSIGGLPDAFHFTHMSGDKKTLYSHRM